MTAAIAGHAGLPVDRHGLALAITRECRPEQENQQENLRGYDDTGNRQSSSESATSRTTLQQRLDELQAEQTGDGWSIPLPSRQPATVYSAVGVTAAFAGFLALCSPLPYLSAVPFGITVLMVVLTRLVRTPPSSIEISASGLRCGETALRADEIRGVWWTKTVGGATGTLNVDTPDGPIELVRIGFYDTEREPRNVYTARNMDNLVTVLTELAVRGLDRRGDTQDVPRPLKHVRDREA